MTPWVTQLRKGLGEFCVLNVLRAGSTYGYQIAKRLAGMEPLALTESTVYPVLSRLKRDGYVEVRTAPSPEGPHRRYFSLTARGQRRVAEMNSYWDHLAGSVAALIAAPGRQGERRCTSAGRSERRSKAI
jgi:PadR family transcriptional regulator PadR